MDGQLLEEIYQEYKPLIYNYLYRSTMNHHVAERTLIILRDYYAFEYRDIAKVVGMTEGQVKIGLHRSRKKFKEKYQRESEVE